MFMQGEIWEVEFMPQRGAEIDKVRPAVIISSPLAGKLPLHIVVPITDWKPVYQHYFWSVPMQPSAQNGLHKPSGADAFQVKSVDVQRLVRRIGTISHTELQTIIDALILCLESP
jgi:mRNA interferase MazF